MSISKSLACLAGEQRDVRTDLGPLRIPTTRPFREDEALLQRYAADVVTELADAITVTLGQIELMSARAAREPGLLTFDTALFTARRAAALCHHFLALCDTPRSAAGAETRSRVRPEAATGAAVTH